MTGKLEKNYLCLVEKFIYQDEELGAVILSLHPMARRFIFRSGKNGLEVTVPADAGKGQVAEVIRRNREKIKKLLEKTPDRRLHEGQIIETLDFRITIRCGKTIGFRFCLDGDKLDICCPENTDFNRESVQNILERGIKSYVKRAASVYLPARAARLAGETGCTYRDIVISHGRKRLGKCDIRRVITLSYYLMFLPERICDYVIYHELAHLTEMNHGENFHRICDRYCRGSAGERERELRKFVFPVS